MDYQVMKGLREGTAGLVRVVDEGALLTARGLKAGEKCTLCGRRGETVTALGVFDADRGGGLNTRIGERADELLLTGENGAPLLYMGRDLPTFLWLLRRAQQKPEPEKPEPKKSEPKKPEPEKSEPEKPVSAAPLPIKKEPPSAAKTQRKEAYSLRDPGEGAPVDALPALLWPEEARQFEPYFERFPPVGMALPAGWRCVRVRPESGPEYILGRRETEDRVDVMLFARRCAGGADLAQGEALYGADGTQYRALYREVSGEARSSRAGRA